jgi:hypothetical protein
MEKDAFNLCGVCQMHKGNDYFMRKMKSKKSKNSTEVSHRHFACYLQNESISLKLFFHFFQSDAQVRGHHCRMGRGKEIAPNECETPG